MEKIRIAIVDDSPFQVSIISDLLTENGFEVVGSAGSLEEVKSVISEVNPDLVTMDMTIPGTDGLECTRAIHNINSDIKVVIVSSMMDDEIIRKAKKARVSGYIQKPVDAEELTLLINRIMADEELFLELQGYYSKVFEESISDVFNKLTKTVPTFQDEKACNTEQSSRGISIVMGIIGKYSGRMILDMSHDTANKLAENLLRKAPKNTEEVLNVMGEMANMTAGNACSMLNKRNKLYGFRVAPPTIFHGESINISKGEIEVNFCAVALTQFGEVGLSVGFNRGDEVWMSNI